MFTRRTTLTAAGVLAASMAAALAKRLSSNDLKSKTTVSFDVPHGACDSHVHVVGDPVQFPMAPDRDYTPPLATADDLREVLQFLHLDRVIIVTPTVYGTDNSATIAAIKLLGRERARGVVLIDDTTSPRILDSYADSGITGIRHFLYGGESFNAAAAAKHLQTRFNLAKQRGWHLDISSPPEIIAALAAPLASSPVPLVFDAFGWLAGGVREVGFDAVMSLVKSGQSYVKFAEPYRVSKRRPDYPDLVPVVHALVEANPDRMLWGSGWPHVDSSSVQGRSNTDPAPNLPDDDGHLLNLFAAWVPDAEVRRKILADNPARLHGF